MLLLLRHTHTFCGTIHCACRHVVLCGTHGKNVLFSAAVKGVDPDTLLVGVVGEEQFDFCMCNPPFYGVDEGHHGDQRPLPPHSTCSGQLHEVRVQGGEVGFVSRMAEESLLLRSRVRWVKALLTCQGWGRCACFLLWADCPARAGKRMVCHCCVSH